MPVTTGEIKDCIEYFRVTTVMDDRIREVAAFDGQSMSEWIRLAVVEKLQRDEARQAKRRGGNGGHAGRR